MDFLVRVYEMKFEEFLTSCTCMKWSVKWFYEMQTLNIASQNFTIFHTISVLTFYEMVYETVLLQDFLLERLPGSVECI